MKSDFPVELKLPVIDERLATRSSWRDWSQGQEEAISDLVVALESGEIGVETVEQCPCGSSQFALLSTIDRFSLPSPTVLCMDCALIITTPRIAQSSIDEYYRSIYPRLLSSKLGADQLKHLYSESQGEKVFDFVIGELGSRSSVNILDFGAGMGDVSEYLKDKLLVEGTDSRMFGVEPNSVARRRLREKGISVVEGVEVFELSERFDLIVLSHIVEHVHDFRSLIARLATLLNPGGLVYIEVPGVLTVHSRANYLHSYTGYAIHAHLYNFCMNSLKRHISHLDYEFVKANEDVQLLLRKRARKIEVPALLELTQEQESLARQSVPVICNYIRTLEDIGPRLNERESLVRELDVTRSKLVGFQESLRSSEIMLNSQIGNSEYSEQVESCFASLDIFERIPAKSWLLAMLVLDDLTHSIQDFPIGNVFYIPGSQILKNKAIQLTKQQSAGYFYSPEDGELQLVIKPGKGINCVHFSVGESTHSIDREQLIGIDVLQGVSVVSVTVEGDSVAQGSYAVLLKPKSTAKT